MREITTFLYVIKSCQFGSNFKKSFFLKSDNFLLHTKEAISRYSRNGQLRYILAIDQPVIRQAFAYQKLELRFYSKLQKQFLNLISLPFAYILYVGLKKNEI